MHTGLFSRLFVTFTAAAAAVTVAASKSEQNQMVFDPLAKETVEIAVSDKPSLNDLLTVDRSLSLFYGYLRESTGLVERLANPLATTSIFAPVDSSIISLSRKPHQGPPPEDRKDDAGLSTEDQEKEAAAYLEKWIKSHMVAGTDIDFTTDKEIETLAGDDARLSFIKAEDASVEGEPQDWQKVLVRPNNARILQKKEGKDGVIYVVDKVLQLES